MKRSNSFFFSIVCVKRSDSVISILLHNIKIVLWCLNFEQVKFCILINLMNNIVIVLVSAKCSKLITSEENIISVQQLPLCLPLIFVFLSEVLKSGIKSCFDWVVFQDVVIAPRQDGFMFPYVWEIKVRKNLRIFEGCHFPRFYILIWSSFRKIETKDLNSDPCFFNLVKLWSISPAAHFLNCRALKEVRW